jgi:hypothetical protein
MKNQRPSVAEIKNMIVQNFSPGDIVDPKKVREIMNCPVPFSPEETLIFLAKQGVVIQTDKPDSYRVVRQIRVNTLPKARKKERAIHRCPHCKGKRVCSCSSCKKTKVCSVCLGLGWCYANNQPLIDFPLL